jgi:catechol 2,3-dioxygenase-like lactoylglutathione lyase family enzyme
MDVLFVSSVAVVSADPPASRKLFIDALGLPLEPHPASEYYSSEKVEGTRHFGVWPLAEAAQACFGTTTWPSDRTVPQASIEFEVASPALVEAGAQELAAQGHILVHSAREEPWGQTVARVISPEGVIVGISYAPWMHSEALSKSILISSDLIIEIGPTL